MFRPTDYSKSVNDIYSSGDSSFYNESGELVVIDEDTTLSTEGLKEYEESLICYELSCLPQEKIEKFLVSEEFQIMQEKGLIGKKTMVKLSKTDDLERRIGMAAIQFAKDKGDPLYDRLITNRVKERKILDDINKRYANPAKKIAMIQQKEFIKNSKIPLTYAR